MGSAPKHSGRVSVVLVNWNTRDLLRACLRSLSETAAEELREILVVDNASTDGSAEMVTREFPTVRLFANARNTRYAAANNQAAQAARGEHLLILNPDTELQPGTVRRLREFLEQTPAAAAVAPRLIHPDGRSQQSVRAFPTPRNILTEAVGLSRLAPRSRVLGAYRMGGWTQDKARQVDQPMTSCLLVRRTAWEALGGMDEGFPMFFNDVDLCYRLKAGGGEIWFLPDVEVLHHVGASTRQVKPAMIVASHRGLERFYRKHYLGRVPFGMYLLVQAVSRVSCLGRLAWQRLRQ